MWCSNLQRLTFKKCDNYWFFWMSDIDLQPYCNFIAPTSVSSHEFWRVHETKFIKKPENFDFFWNIHNLDNTTYNYDINMSVIVVIEMIAGCFFVDTVIIARILWVSLYHQPVQSIKSVIKAAYTQPIQQYLLFSIGIKNM